jgi:hypothetical protein
MGFGDRQYDLYVILGNPELSPIWTEPAWSHIASALDPLIQMVETPTAVRTLQLRPGPGSPNQRAISFGRIGWNQKGHDKWVHQVSGNDGTEELPQFINAEIWAPHWKTCEKRNWPPDVYVAFRNEKTWAKLVKFNPAILIAVAKDRSGRMSDQGRTIAARICQVVSSVLHVHSERPWARPLGQGGMHDSINYRLTTGLFKVGPIHNRHVSAEMLEGAWQTF